ncbi:MAG: tetratricopeptide repeat protein [Rhodobacteraceae bacterium]|nr:tetratricopeptide repeat protein [Paracoccaceae bacterium]
MRRFSRLMAPLALVLVAAPVLADGCPAAPDHRAELQGLISQIQRAPDETSARLISNRMWEYWADAPNEQAQSILDRGMSRRASHDFLGALEDFDKLVEYCPNYAEGYNQRAFVKFLRHDFDAAITDLDRALKLSPDHVAALSGKALSLFALGRLEEARVVLGDALKLNPWLPERGLAAPGGPLEPEGTDL